MIYFTESNKIAMFICFNNALYLYLLAGDEAPAPALPDLDADRGLALEHVLEKRGDLLHPPGLQCLRTLQLASPGHSGNTADHDTSYLQGQPRQQGGLLIIMYSSGRKYFATQTLYSMKKILLMDHITIF